MSEVDMAESFDAVMQSIGKPKKENLSFGWGLKMKVPVCVCVCVGGGGGVSV